MKNLNKKIRNAITIFFLMFTLFFSTSVFAETSYYNGTVDFNLINPADTRNIIGNTFIIGNTSECLSKYYYYSSNDLDIPTSMDDLLSSSCEDDLTVNDNTHFVKYVDIDNDASTFNSSSATVNFPDTYKKIAWAGIFWQGHINDYSYQFYSNGWNLSNDFPGDIKGTTANKIKIKIGDGSYQEIEADRLDYLNDSRDSLLGTEYSAFADITDKLTNLTSNTTITVANVTSSVGLDVSLGDYAAWTIVIVYDEDSQNPNSKLRNNSVYYGYKVISNGNPDSITVSDYLLPRTGTVDSQMAVFAAEGEYVYSPDSIELNGVKLGADVCTTSKDDPSCKDNIFDAKLSPAIIRDPSLTNNNGIDIDVFDTSAIMTQQRDDNPDATSYSSTIDLTSDWDMYFPSMVSFTTELYKPRVCYYIDKITDADNNIVYENKAFTQDIVQNQKYQISLWIANMQQDLTDTNIEVAKKVKVSVDYSNFDYSNESTYIQNIGDTSFSHITDAVDGDIGEFYIDINQSDWRVGAGADNVDGGTINPTFDFNDNTNKVFVDINGTFLIDDNTTEINLDDIFTFKASYSTDYLSITNPIPIPKCQDFSTIAGTYVPSAGSYNVLNQNYSGGSDPLDVNSSINSLYTQVTNKQFTVNVVSLDSDYETPKNSHSMVMVDLIKNPNNEAECQSNTYLAQATAIFDNQSYVPINFTYDKANKELRFRVKYLVDSYGSLIDWSSVGACSNNTGSIYNDYACIWGILTGKIYDNSVCNEGNGYPEDQCPCAAECNPASNSSPNHNEECVECVFNSPDLTRSTCSRDAFAIRPATYSINIPNSSTTYMGGKTYTIDANATDGISDANVSGYDQSIDNSLDKNGTVKLILPTGCTDLNATETLFSNSVNFTNGSLDQPAYFTYNNVGDVNVTINDRDWTKIDQSSYNGKASDDCIVGSSSNVPDSSGKVGCLVQGGKVFKFIPKAFRISLQLSNFANQPFTYVSSDGNMSAQIDWNFAAILDDNTSSTMDDNPIATNYTRNCFSRDINYTVKLINTKSLAWSDTKNRIKFYADTNSSEISNQGVGFADFNTSQANFVSGVANNVKTHFNFERNVSIADEPFQIFSNDFNITNVSDTDGVTGSDFNRSVNQSVSFYYARLHTPNYSAKGDTAQVSMYHEVYCKDCNQSIFISIGGESVDSVYWYINKDDNNISNGKIFNFINSPKIDPITIPTAITNGVENTTVTYNAGIYPYRERIEVNSSSWLVYNPYDANATTTDFLVDFSSYNDWAGVGTTGKTVDLNISTKGSRRIEW